MNIFKDFWLAFLGDEDSQRAVTKANLNKKNTNNVPTEPELDCYDLDEFELFNGDLDDEFFE